MCNNLLSSVKCLFVITSPIFQIPLTNEMLKSSRSAHSRYIAALGKKRNATVSQKPQTEIAEIKKKRVLEAAIKSFETDIEEYSIAAEKENSLTLLTKANSVRVTVHQKKNIVSRKNFGEIERKAQTNLRYVFMMKL